MDFRVLAREHGVIAILEIRNGVGERSERDRVGAEIHRTVTVADGERRALARADQKVLLCREQKGERKRAAQARQGGSHSRGGRASIRHLVTDEMGDDFGIGFRPKLRALLLQLLAQLAKILDDAVVHHGEPLGRMGMGVVLGGFSMGRPARVTDADRAAERLAGKPCFELTQLAFGAPARELPVFQRRNTGGIIAAVLQPLERIEQRGSDGFAPENTHDSTHASSGS